LGGSQPEQQPVVDPMADAQSMLSTTNKNEFEAWLLQTGKAISKG